MEFLNKKIFVFDDVLTKKECNTLISIYNVRGHTHEWQSFFPMSISKDDEQLISFAKKAMQPIKNIFSFSIDIDWCELVKWPEKSFMSPHRDFAKQETIFTSITYLNDNYSGGYTYLLNDIQFKPKTGRTIYFDGQHYEHGVSTITKGLRYTMPIWYKS